VPELSHTSSCIQLKSGQQDNIPQALQNLFVPVCSCLDGVISHLQKQVETLKSYQRQPQESVEANGAVQSKIVDMYDVCAYIQINKATLTLTQEDTLLQRSTKLRCQLLLATCAVFAQKLLHRSSYTSGYRQHCMYTLLHEHVYPAA